MSLRYALCTVIGIGLAVAGVALVAAAVYAFTRAGTCASGAPLVAVQECTDGIGSAVARMVGGVAGIMLGPVVFAARGRDGGTAVGLAGAAWGMFWIAAAAAIWTASRGADSQGAGYEAVTTTLVVVFGLMGAIPVVLTLFAVLVGRRPSGPGPGPGPGGGEVRVGDDRGQSGGP